MPDVLGVIRAYAAAHGIGAPDAAREATALLTNTAPEGQPLETDESPPTVAIPLPSWRQREEWRHRQQREVAAAVPASEAETVAFLARERARCVTALAELPLPAALRTLYAELMLVTELRHKGLGDTVAAAMLLEGIERALDTPGSLVRHHGWLAPIHDLRSALRAAAASHSEPLLRFVVLRDDATGRTPRDQGAALHDGLLGGGVAAMLLGGVSQGAARTPAQTEEWVMAALHAENIVLADRRPRKAYWRCRNLERRAAHGQALDLDEQDMLTVFQVTVQAAQQHLGPTPWPPVLRQAWLAKWAYGMRTQAA
jgi:hypothetical protein